MDLQAAALFGEKVAMELALKIEAFVNLGRSEGAWLDPTTTTNPIAWTRLSEVQDCIWLISQGIS